MRAIVAIFGALGALAIGVWAVQIAIDETADQSGVSADVHEFLSTFSADLFETLAFALPWIGIAAIAMIGLGVLVASGRGR